MQTKMMPEKYRYLHAIPAVTFALVLIITIVRIDSGGDIPGALRCLIYLLGLSVWSITFAVLMGVHIVKSKHLIFGIVAILLIPARIAFISTLSHTGGEQIGICVCLPMEYLLYYWRWHSDTKEAKLSFLKYTAILHGLALVVSASSLRLL